MGAFTKSLNSVSLKPFDLIHKHLFLGLQVSANTAHPESSQFTWFSTALLHRGSQKEDLPFHLGCDSGLFGLQSFICFQLMRGMGVTRIPLLVSQHPGRGFVLFMTPQLLLQHRLEEAITTWVQANVGYHPAKRETFQVQLQNSLCASRYNRWEKRGEGPGEISESIQIKEQHLKSNHIFPQFTHHPCRAVLLY